MVLDMHSFGTLSRTSQMLYILIILVRQVRLQVEYYRNISLTVTKQQINIKRDSRGSQGNVDFYVNNNHF